jgi:glutaredoxin
MSRARLAVTIVIALAATSALAQLYRWTDEKGRVHITDTPPPSTAKDVQKKGATSSGPATQMPYELSQALKEFPVTLYSAPNCKDLCSRARELLNKRGVPFKEIQVFDERTNEQLKAAGAKGVPALVVGRSVHEGYDAAAYNDLLDSARYPKPGVLPPRTQAAPAAPEGYTDPAQRPAAKAEPVKPEPEAPQPTGPYAPRAAPPKK